MLLTFNPYDDNDKKQTLFKLWGPHSWLWYWRFVIIMGLPTLELSLILTFKIKPLIFMPVTDDFQRLTPFAASSYREILSSVCLIFLETVRCWIGLSAALCHSCVCCVYGRHTQLHSATGTIAVWCNNGANDSRHSKSDLRVCTGSNSRSRSSTVSFVHGAPYLEREAAAVQPHSIRPQVLILIHFWVTVKKVTAALNLELPIVTTEQPMLSY